MARTDPESSPDGREVVSVTCVGGGRDFEELTWSWRSLSSFRTISRDPCMIIWIRIYSKYETYPSWLETLTHCWTNVCNAGPTLPQHCMVKASCLLGHWFSAGPTPTQHWLNFYIVWWTICFWTNKHWTIVGSMLVHRLRRWTNIKPTVVQRLACDGEWQLKLQSLLSPLILL